MLARPIKEGELAKIAKGVDEALHLELQDLTRCVVSMQAQNSKLAGLRAVQSLHLLIKF